MGTVSFKFLFNIILIFTVAMVNSWRSKNLLNCEQLIGPLSHPEITPIRYNIRLIIRPLMRVVLGEIDIMFDLNEPLLEFTRAQSLYNHSRYTEGLTALSLYARELKPDIKHTVIRKIAPPLKDSVKTAAYKLVDFSYCKDEILNLIFEKPLIGGRYSLHMKYTSALNLNEDMFYPYIWTQDVNKWLFTNLYTTNATRALFPCWDDPSFKSTYNISIKHPTDYTVFFSQPAQKTSFDEFGTQWTHYEDFSSVESYSLAFALIDGITRKYEQHGIHFMWNRAKAKGTLSYAHQMADKSLSYFIQKLQLHITSDFPKIDHIVLPNSPMKSMGGYGVAIYREEDVTYNKDSDFPGRSIDVTKLMAYEMARQVFVNLVGRHTKSDRLINEMLASFYSFYAVHEMRKTDRLLELFTVQAMPPALETDYFNESKAVAYTAKDDGEMDSLFYSLLHHKKAFILFRMLLNILTPGTFHDVIRKYVWTRTEDLWTIMNEMSPPEKHGMYTIKEIIDSWLTTTYHHEVHINIFFPLEYATLSFKTITPDNLKVPLTALMSSNLGSYDISKITYWLKYPDFINIAVPKNSGFLLINIDQLGYFRINYPIENWQMIVKYLKSNNFTRIPVLNRAQLINDAFYFAITGELEGRIFLDLISYLKKEMDYIAWYPVFRIMSYTSDYIKFSENGLLKERFREILSSLLATVGYEPQSNSDGMRMSLILLARKWACEFGILECRDAATNQLKNYMKTIRLNRVPRISKQWILCSGMMGVNESVWNDVMRAGLKTYKSMEILEYLSCSERSDIIIGYLKLILQEYHFTDAIQPMGQICRTVIKKHVTKPHVLRYVIQNYNIILDRFPVVFRSGILLSDMIMNVYKIEQLDLIKDFAYTKYVWNSGTPSATSFNDLLYRRKMHLIKIQKKFNVID